MMKYFDISNLDTYESFRLTSILKLLTMCLSFLNKFEIFGHFEQTKLKDQNIFNNMITTQKKTHIQQHLKKKESLGQNVSLNIYIIQTY